MLLYPQNPQTVLCCASLTYAISLHKRQARHGAVGCTYYSAEVSFFSCPTCSFYALVVQGQRSYHLCPSHPHCPSHPSHPSHPCLPRPSHPSDHLCPSCFRLRYDYHCAGCCRGGPGPHSGLDLCLHGDPGLRGDRLHCVDRSCRCGGGDRLHGAPCLLHVCPVNCLSVLEAAVEGSWVVNWSDWGALSSGCRSW